MPYGVICAVVSRNDCTVIPCSCCLPATCRDSFCQTTDCMRNSFWNSDARSCVQALRRSAGSVRSPALSGSGERRSRRHRRKAEANCHTWFLPFALLQSYKNNFSLKVPVNFNGNVPCSRNTLANRYIINQRFHNLTGKVFQVGVLFNQFAAIITCRNFFFDFG